MTQNATPSDTAAEIDQQDVPQDESGKTAGPQDQTGPGAGKAAPTKEKQDGEKAEEKQD